MKIVVCVYIAICIILACDVYPLDLQVLKIFLLFVRRLKINHKLYRGSYAFILEDGTAAKRTKSVNLK
jgi:hypothetical protein